MSIHVNPRGGQVRALERHIITYRALQMALAIYYAEELKRIVVRTIQSTDNLQLQLKMRGAVDRVPSGSKDQLKKALEVWVSESLLTVSEAKEIRSLIDYRNHIAHRIQHLTADVTTKRWAADVVKHGLLKATYNYEAPDELKAWISTLYQRVVGSSLVCELNFNDVLFETAESAIKSELKLRDAKIRKLFAQRELESQNLLAQLQAIFASYKGASAPTHPSQTDRNGRLTKFGVETCYSLFDDGYSVAVVAHAFNLSMGAVARRRKSWKAQRAG